MRDANSILQEPVVFNQNVKGVFTIELAIVLAIMSGTFVLVLNHLMAFSKKGPLDRAAYSLVTILSERTQLFDENVELCSTSAACDQLAEDAFTITTNSMRRMNQSFDIGKLGMRIDQVSISHSFDSKGNITYTLDSHSPLFHGNTSQCSFPGVTDVTNVTTATELLPLTDKGTYLPMYQVSLCYAIPLDMLGVMSGEFLRLVSTSYSFARI